MEGFIQVGKCGRGMRGKRWEWRAWAIGSGAGVHSLYMLLPIRQQGLHRMSFQQRTFGLVCKTLLLSSRAKYSSKVGSDPTIW